MSVKNVEDVYALSPMQQLMLLQACSADDQGVLVEQFTCSLIGHLDRDAFREAWNEVVRRHPVLRTGFAWQGLKKPLQFVRRQATVDWQEYDLCDRSEIDPVQHWTEIKDADRRKGFDLTSPPLTRVSLARTGAETYRLAWTVHHLVLDGWSVPLVLRDVFALYEAFQNGAGVPSQLPTAAPFSGYIRWLSQQDPDAARNFWRTRFADYRPDSRISPRGSVGACQHFGPVAEYDEFETLLSTRSLAELRTLAAEQRITVGTLLLAVWGFLLGRLQGREDVIFGIAVSGRPATLAGAETIVGPLMNNLPFRVQLQRNQLVADWLRATQSELADVQQFEYIPCEQICDLPSGGRPFESLFVYENYPCENSERIGADLEIRDACGTATSSLPLTVIVIPDGELRLRIRYCTRDFSPADVQRLASHFDATLENIVACAEQRLVDVGVCSPRERAELDRLAAKPPPDEIVTRIKDEPLSLIKAMEHDGDVTWRIVDHWNQPAAMGVAGELCATGPCLDQPHPAEMNTSDEVLTQTTGKRQNEGQTLIRTGLHVRRFPDGEWQWLGHAHGVPVGDCRVDLDAVRKHVFQHAWVVDVTVSVHDAADGRASLAVYVVPAEQSKSLLDTDGQTLVSAQLQSGLGDVLPLPVLSFDIVALDHIPKLADGTTDIASLPPPRRSRPETGRTYVAPRDSIETRLAKIWSELLGVHPVGVHDHFTELGGHSALAVSLIGRIEKEFQRKLPLVAMFSEPTVENLATLLRRPAASLHDTVLIPIRPDGDRQPLFCVHPAGGTVFCYLELARHLPPNQPVYGLQAVGVDGRQAPHTTVTEMAARYVAEMRSAQSDGPYAICGWSSGGIIAYEVARQLESAGQRVSLLALFDAAIRSDAGEYTPEDVLAMLLMMFPGDSRQEIEALRDLSLADQLTYFEQRAKSARLILENTDQSQIRYIHDVFQANAEAIASYRPKPYGGTITLFRAATAATPMHRDPLLGWGKLSRNVEVCEVPGVHVTMFREPTIRTLASLVERYL